MSELLTLFIILFITVLIFTAGIVAMSWDDPIKRNKNPWLAALLALVFGPFGFLYYSWKLTVAFLVPVIWIVLKQVLYFGGIVWVYPVVCLQLAMLAAFAFMDVMRRSKKRPV